MTGLATLLDLVPWSKIKQLPWKIIGIAVLALACFAAGWTAQGWRADARIAGNAADQAVARARSSEEARATERALSAGFAAQDSLLAEQRRKTDEEISRLGAGLSAGTVVLRVRAVCPAAGLPGGAADPGEYSGAGAVLDPAAGPDYLALRSGIERVEAKLAACQGVLGAMGGGKRE